MFNYILRTFIKYTFNTKIIFIVIVFTNCSSSSKNSDTDSSTPEDLNYIVSLFFQEAEKRGWNINSKKGDIFIQFGKSVKGAGSCKPNTTPKVFTINAIIWKDLSDEQKEKLVFHELGHCLLNLQHDNTLLAFGECKSWMRERDSVCITNLANAKWRQYYVDELFSKKRLRKPEWYN